MEPQTPLNLTDHDLLIRLDTRMGTLTDEMRLLRDGTTNDIKDLKERKLDRRDFEEYKRECETSINKVATGIDERFEKVELKAEASRTWILIATGVLIAAQFAIPIVLRYFGI